MGASRDLDLFVADPSCPGYLRETRVRAQGRQPRGLGWVLELNHGPRTQENRTEI